MYALHRPHSLQNCPTICAFDECTAAIPESAYTIHLLSDGKPLFVSTGAPTPLFVLSQRLSGEREVFRDKGPKGAPSAYWSLEAHEAKQFCGLKGLGEKSQIFQISIMVRPREVKKQ